MVKKDSKKSSTHGIKNLDVLGTKFRIGFPTRTGKLQTTLGGYLTIVMGLLSTTMFVIVMSQFFYSNSPVVMTSSEFGSQINTYDLYKESLYPLISIQLGLGDIPASQMKRFVTVKAFIDSLTFDTSPGAASPFNFSVFRIFDYKICSEVDDPLIKKYVRELTDQEGFDQIITCPDFKGQQADFKMHEDYVNTHFKRVSIRIYPCSLPDKTQCASIQEIDNLQTSYGYPFKVLEPSNRTHPMISAPIMKSTKVDRRSSKLSKQKITKHKVMDDTLSSLTPPKVNIEYATMSEDSIDFSVRDPNQI